MKTLTLAFPCKFQIHARFAMTLMDVVEKLKKCQTEWQIKTEYLMGKSNLSHARSVMVTEWYEKASDEDGFFFIDSDHTFTEEDILRVTRQKGDINAGIYCNRDREPTCFPLEGRFTDQAENIPLRFAATGFLFFTKATLTRIHNWMKEKEDLDRVVISDFPDHVESRTIPFFHSVIEPKRADGKRFWLGEDFSFSYRAIQAGLKIMGCITYSLGHEIPYVVFYDKPRRPAVQWLPQVVAVYCGAIQPPEDLLEQCRLLTAKGTPVVVFSKRVEDPTSLLIFKRYEEFQAHDNYSTLVIWDTEALGCMNFIGKADKLVLYLSKFVTSMPVAYKRVTRVLFSSVELWQKYNTLFEPSLISLESLSANV